MDVFKQNGGLIGLLSDAISEGIIVVNQNQIIVATNKASNELFGYEHEALIGKPLNTLIPEKYHPDHGGHFQKFMGQSQKRQMGGGRDLYGVRSDGSEFPVEVGLNPFEIYGVTYVMTLVIDITESKRSKEELKILNRELEQKIALRTELLLKSETELKIALKKEEELGVLKSLFVSMASHEFRTPLSAIRSSVDLLSRYHGMGIIDKQVKHFERIRRSVRNLVTTLDDFLSLEKMESGTVAMHPVQLDFGDYIQDVLTEVGPWKKTGQQVVHEHSGDQKVGIDPNLVRNVLLNVLSNALKYSPDGSIVKVVTHNEGGKLAMAVIDSGMGIPEEEQEKMFTRYFRASNTEEISGTGLGLTIVKRYLDLMQGDISFVSKAGKGTTFNIVIPLC